MGLILILAWMFNTSELDELFRILNSIKGFKLRQPQWSNTTVALGENILNETTLCVRYYRTEIDCDEVNH